MPDFIAFKQSRNSGFTLIELLIVVFIIAMMVTIAVLNINLGVGDSALKESAKRLHAVLQMAHEEAILFNRPVGIVFESDNYAFYSYQKAPDAAPDPNASNTPSPQPDQGSEYRWQLIEAAEYPNKKIFFEASLAEGFEFEVYLDSEEANLYEDSYGLDEIDGEPVDVIPMISFEADGETYPEDFEVKILQDFSDAYASIQLDETGDLRLLVDEAQDQ